MLDNNQLNWEFWLTVGELRNYLKNCNLPDDTPVVYERIQDVYFEKHGWKVYKPDVDEDHDLAFSEFVRVWCPFVIEDPTTGKKVLALTAHY